MDKNKTNKKTKSGFSLVELLIVFAIMIIMTSILLANQNNNKAKSDVEAAARQVAAQLRQLQNDALNGKQVNNGSGTMINACDFILNIGGAQSDGVTSTATTYVIYNRDCTIAGHVPIKDTSNNIIKQTFNFNKNNKVTASSASFVFSSPRGDVLSGNIVLSEGSSQITVCVYSSGNVTELKGFGGC